MSSALSMSLDESIKKSKDSNKKGGPGRRGGFKKSFGRREGDSFRNKRGGRRERGGRRFGGDRDRERSSRGGRGRFERERGPRSFREGREKREGGEGRSTRPEKVGLKARAIFRTGARKPRPAATTETTVVRQTERPISERRRLRVSNLDFNITHKDLMELFSKLGTITKNKIEYDDLGRSKGTAMIEYEKHEGAIKAMKEYDGAVLDGKTISVEFDDDVKAKTGSNLIRKTITKEPRFEERDRRRYDDRDRNRNRDRDDDRRYKSFRSDRDRGDKGFRGDRDRGFKGGDRGFRGGDRNRRFRSNRRD